MKISIDEDKCTGCGSCVPNCHLGIIEVRDGKARVMNANLCDGAGRCLGHCPTGALSLKETPQAAPAFPAHDGGCPGSRVIDLRTPVPRTATSPAPVASGGPATELRQWPVQLKLLPPRAPFFQNADLVLAADCTAFSRADFHDRFLRGRALAIACPKLDSEPGGYVAKLTTIFSEAGLRSVQVLHMEVPCCYGLWEMARQAWIASGKSIPMRRTVLGTQSEIISDAWAPEN